MFGVIFLELPLAAQMNWKEIRPPRSQFKTFFATKSGVLLLFDDNSFYRSSDAGATWSENSAGFPQRNNSAVSSIIEDGNGILWLSVVNSDSNRIYRSDDSGAIWETRTFSAGGLYGNLSALFCNQSGTFYGIFRYQNNGHDTTRVVTATTQPINFSFLDAPQSIELMMSGGILFGRTTEKVVSQSDRYPLWEFYPQTGQWAKIFTPTYDGNGDYPYPTHIAVLPTGERFIAANHGSFVRQNIYYSPDAGKTWQFMLETKFGNAEKRCYGLVPLTDTSVAMLFSFHTDNNIDTLLVKQNGIWILQPLTQLQNRGVMGFGGIDNAGNLYIVSNDGSNSYSRILRLPPNRSHWITCGLSNPHDANIDVSTDSKNRLFVRYRSGALLRSDDEGKYWRPLDEYLPRQQEALTSTEQLVIADDDNAYILLNKNVLVSIDAGITWKTLDLGGLSVDKLLKDRSRVFAVGAVIREISGGIPGATIAHTFGENVENIALLLKLQNGSYLLRVKNANIYQVSTNAGATWTDATFTAFPLQYQRLTDPIEMSDGTLYTVFTYNILDSKSIYRSSDAGKSWTRTDFGRVFHEKADYLTTDRAGIPYIVDGTNGVVRITPFFDGATNVGLKNTALFSLSFNQASEPYAYDWSVIFKGTPVPGDFDWERTGSIYTPSGDNRIISIGSKQNNEVWIASTQAGTLRTVNNGGFWSGRDMQAGMLIFKLFVDSGNMVFNCTNSGIYQHDGGFSWEEKNGGIPTPIIIYDMLEDAAGNFYAATFGNGIYRSTDKGQQWEEFSAGIRNSFTRGLTIDPNGNIYAATNGGIYVLEKSKSSWLEISGNLGDVISGSEIEVAFGYLYCYTDKKLQRTALGTTNWSPELPESVVNSLYLAKNNWLFACTKDGIWKKTNAPAAWERFAFAGKEVFVMGENATYYFAGLDDNRVYRLSKGFTGVENDIQPDFSGVYPNPADREVTLTLPDGTTELTIINALGEVVARHELSSLSGHLRYSVEELPAGVYMVKFSGRNFVRSELFVKP